MKGLTNKERLLNETQALTKTGSWEWNIQTNENQWSDEFYRIHGLKVNGPIPLIDEYMDLVHPDDRSMMINALDCAIKVKNSYEIEYRILTANTYHLRYLRSIGKLHLNEKGEKVLVGCTQDVTDLMVAKHQQRESEKRSDAIFQSIPLMLLVIDQDLHILKSNRENLKISNEDFSSSQNLKPGDVIECIQTVNSDHQCTTGVDCTNCVLRNTIEKTLNTKKEYKNVEASISVVRNGINHNLNVLVSTSFLSTKSKHILVVIDDITPRKKIEKALTESENRFKTLFNKSVDSIFIVDAKTAKIADINDTVCQHFKYSRNELIGKPIAELLSPNHKEYLLNNFKKYASGDAKALKSSPDEFVMLTKYGEHLNIEGLAEKVIIKGKPYIMAVIRDISKRKTSEKQLKEAQRIAHIGSWHFEMSSKTAGWSDMMYTITGIPRSSTKLLDAFRTIIYDKDRLLFNKALRSLLIDGDHFESIDFRIINQQTRKLRYVKAESKQYYDKRNRLISISGTIQDITEQKATQKDLIAAKEKAEESDRLKSAFIANMSHEIRTPMNGIVGFADLLMNEEMDVQEIVKFASIIQKSSMQLLAIVNDILDISSIETGQMKITNEALNLESLINELYEFHFPKISAKGLAFEKDIQPCSQKLISDGMKIKQILNNLISNAYKFTNQGSIKITCKHDKQQVIITLEDTGIGIPESFQNQIFKRFSQVHSSHNKMKGGTGLGLAISKNLSKMLGGDLTFERNRKTGSSFTLSLPFVTT